MDKQTQYAAKILAQLAPMFSDEDCENFIGAKELNKGNNATELIHAIANIVPCRIYESVTGEAINMLDFNHIANKLCFQNITSKD